MKKSIPYLLLICAILLCGCAKKEAPRVLPEKGDFSFSLPEWYTLADVQDTCCLIQTENGLTVGGIRLADILPKELEDSESPAVYQYLDSIVPGCEFFSWVGENEENRVYQITMQFSDPDYKDKRVFVRYIFQKADIVYDMWFDTNYISDEQIAKFSSIVE